MSDLPTVAVPGGRVEFDDVPGSPSLAPLLFLHEGLGSVALWRGWHRRVAQATGRRTVAWSRLGHGWSDPPPAPREVGFMHEEAAVVVPALREALGLADPVLVGHSDGASIALLHAASAPVGGLVVLAPHVFTEAFGLVGVRAARDAFDGGDLRTRMARRHRDPDVAFRNWNDVWLSDAFREWDLRPALPGITCPVLAVQGTTDPYGTLAHVEAVRDLATGPVELLVLDCAHAPHLEAPEATTDAVLRYLGARP
ncbi:alpha/beta fold hydrolase [Pseudonocardia oceani]|uniref:Alpha/beta hydrolase n=3 Tax=Pseudonocardia oceani TaxID=2792013 RepID=A0ABS6UJD5_9PSEU|nr:alpha/beta hydrolase [Pseudonocardia oceani]MBW0121295.1 alpha/beta hydrolase [Pseudonocardia oceani]MBW0132353.1 alpha/beta hydrolase [Pseudonocardia oceani]